MAGFGNIQGFNAQSIQAALTETEAQLPEEAQASVAYASPLGADAAVLTGGGPSYMQAVEALMVAQMALNLNSANTLGNLHALANGNQAKSAANSEKQQANNANNANGAGNFNPLFYVPGGVNGRSGYGGNGGYSRTGGNNVGGSGIDQMIEMLLSQSMGEARNNGKNPKLLSEDGVTLADRTSEDETNAFGELTDALVHLLAEQINNAGKNAPPPSPQMMRLLAQLGQQPTTYTASSESITQPQLQALMDELSVMQLLQGTRDNSAPPANPMVNNIMQLMQGLLGAKNGGSVSSTQMQSLIGALMSSLQQGDENSPAAAMMKEMLPQMMAMLEQEEAMLPGAIIPKQAQNGASNKPGTVRLNSFKAKVNSNGKSVANMEGKDAESEFEITPGESGSLMILDGMNERDIAGGFGIGASVGGEEEQEKQIKVGTFSWNGGNDAIALNAKGEASVTNDGGRTWAPLPAQGISTYNPGKGAPTLVYNPIAKTVTFTIIGPNNDKVNAEMCADDTGVSFTNIEATGLTAGGQLAVALT